MIVLSPDTELHTLQLIPRYYASGIVTLALKNEESSELLIHAVTPEFNGGYMYISFHQQFRVNSNYSVKVYNDEEVLYRGKLFITGQSENTQAFKISNDTFTYGH